MFGPVGIVGRRHWPETVSQSSALDEMSINVRYLRDSWAYWVKSRIPGPRRPKSAIERSVSASHADKAFFAQIKFRNDVGITFHMMFRAWRRLGVSSAAGLR